MPTYTFTETGTCEYRRTVTVTAANEHEAMRRFEDGDTSGVTEEMEYENYAEADSFWTDDEE